MWAVAPRRSAPCSSASCSSSRSAAPTCRSSSRSSTPSPGLAAASTGFVLDNIALIIGGTLVGASGTLLTVLMGRAMNRSLANVLFGAFGAAPAAGAAARRGERRGEELPGDHGRGRRRDARLRAAASSSSPATGSRSRRPSTRVRELADLLEKRGVDVKYAIHPVAGRMPGHMNVLLAEANVPYPQLYDMEDINPEFPRTDVALVIGANDVTNPAARDDPESPLYGMPILNVDQAAQRRRPQAEHEPGLRRHRQRPLLPAEHGRCSSGTRRPPSRSSSPPSRPPEPGA